MLGDQQHKWITPYTSRRNFVYKFPRKTLIKSVFVIVVRVNGP